MYNRRVTTVLTIAHVYVVLQCHLSSVAYMPRVNGKLTEGCLLIHEIL